MEISFRPRSNILKDNSFFDQVVENLNSDVNTNITLNSPDDGHDIVRYLLSNNVDSELIANSVSLIKNIPIYRLEDGAVDTVLSKESAVISNNVCYMVYPYDQDMYMDIKKKKETGSFVFEKYGIISKSTFITVQDQQADQLYQDSQLLEQTEESKAEAKKLLDDILLDAYKLKSSDIHINPHKEKPEVFFRIAGSLIKQEYSNLLIKNGIFGAMKNIIHIEAGKDYQQALPLSAQFSFSLGFKTIFIRMEVIPTKVGLDYMPKFTLRLLGADSSRAEIDKLGFRDRDKKIFDNIIQKPNGIIVITGPTGSGKSTTLYALLRNLQRTLKDKSIFTIEDPVEIELNGVNQIEVNDKAGLGFNTALKSLMRLDPDIIMVGEIRDLETAQLAIRASLTGHLVLTTLHTNSAFGAIPRLVDLGVEPVLLADSLLGLSAQRLVKKVCTHCSSEIAFKDSGHKIEGFLDEDIIKVANPEGCKQCNEGYSDRIIINEITEIDSDTRQKIAVGSTVDEILKGAVNNGFERLSDDAIIKVKSGQTTIEQVINIL